MRALAGFDHPNLVRLLDADIEEGRAYLVMELVEGCNLAERCAGGPLPEDQVRRLAAAMTAALEYVHARGVVHRDVKPANVLLGPQGRVLLADFGIAQLVDTAGVTTTGLVAGTPAYLAPEQVMGERAGPAADVFSLALVLAECFTGARLMSGSAAEMMAARLRGDPDLPEAIPAPWRALLSAMTRQDPAARPTAGELVAAFGGASASSWVSARWGADTMPLGAVSEAGTPVSTARGDGPGALHTSTTVLATASLGPPRVGRSARLRLLAAGRSRPPSAGRSRRLGVLAAVAACALLSLGIVAALPGAAPPRPPAAHHPKTATGQVHRTTPTVPPATAPGAPTQQLAAVTTTVPPPPAPPGPGGKHPDQGNGGKGGPPRAERPPRAAPRPF